MKCVACGSTIESGRGKCPLCGFPVVLTTHGGKEELEKVQELADEYRNRKLGRLEIGFTEYDYELKNGRLKPNSSRDIVITKCECLVQGETKWYPETFVCVRGDIFMNVFLSLNGKKEKEYKIKIKQPAEKKSWHIGVLLEEGWKACLVVGSPEVYVKQDAISLLEL